MSSGAGGARKKKESRGVQFKLVQQSYEDKDYADKPKPVLVPAAALDKRYKKGRRRLDVPDFDTDMPEDYTDKRNMLMTDDTKEGEEKLFEDQVECDFDENFIKQMMYGAPGGDGDDDDEDDDDDDALGDDAYPRHDTTQRALDKQFTRMMREFDADEEINDPDVDDPRVHGPLEVHQYLNALEEFVEDNAGVSYVTAEPLKNKGLINQLKHMAHKRGAFDSNRDGVFVTTLLPDKQARFVEAYRRETEELKQEAHERAEARRNTEDGPEQEEEEEAAPIFEVVEVKEKERMDCETVLSTYSTLYNHPNIIAAVRKKFNPNQVLADERRRRRAAALAHQQPAVTEGDAQDDDDDDSADGAYIDLSQRSKDESPEEKKLRRQLVKQQQRERRLQKKELKTVYRDCSVKQASTAPKEKQKKAQMSLSLVKGWA